MNGIVRNDYSVGNIYETRTSGPAEIIEYFDSKKILVKFLNTGNFKYVASSNLRNGRIKDTELFDEVFKYRNGTIHKTKNFGDIEVVDYILSNNIKVKFLNTGNEYITSSSCILEGKIADRIYQDVIKDYRKGLTFETERFGKFVIKENIGTDLVKIEFVESGTEQVVTKDKVLALDIEDTAPRTERSSDSVFCVYLHKDSDGVVRYVGEGTTQRAYSKTRADQPTWEAIFRNNPPFVEIVAENLSKNDSEKLELKFRSIHAETIINNKHAVKTPHKISYDFISKYVYYDETSPTFISWVNRMKNNSVANSPAGHRHKNGYVIVEICGTSYAVHRIIWTLHNGDFDSGLVVDHIDGNKHNNSISNLRIVTHKENARNKLLNIPDSGYRQIRKTQNGKYYGVRWTEDSGRKYKQFRIKDYETENDCLNEAYVFRDSLIKCGKLSPRIKEGEAEIGR